MQVRTSVAVPRWEGERVTEYDPRHTQKPDSVQSFELTGFDRHIEQHGGADAETETLDQPLGKALLRWSGWLDLLPIFCVHIYNVFIVVM